MFFMTESTNPFDYMSGLWYLLMAILVVCALLLLVARPLHKIYTDRKTRTIIEEAGVEDEPAAAADDREDVEDEEGGEEA